MILDAPPTIEALIYDEDSCEGAVEFEDCILRWSLECTFDDLPGGVERRNGEVESNGIALIGEETIEYEGPTESCASRYWVSFDRL